MKISIPNPCRENWDKMLPEDKGRFCSVCSKTVVDFTQKSKEQIKNFFQEATGRVCGRFRNEQLSPQAVRPLTSPNKLSLFACALYFVFGSILFSCTNKHVSKKEKQDEEIHTTLGISIPREKDEIKDLINQMGAANDKAVSDENIEKQSCTVGIPSPEFVEGEVIVGDIILEPEKESSSDSDTIGKK